MSSPRIPAPPPPSSRDPRAPAAPADDDLPDDDATSESDEIEDGDTDESLRRPEAWPDDRDEPTIPEGLLDPDLDDLPRLDGVGDDGVEDDIDLPDPEVPLEDDLADLDAPDDTDVPVIPWQFEVRLDGRPVQAKADPGREVTAWLRPGAVASGEADVVLHVAGKPIRVRVQCLPADQEGVLLGRDVLSGRFLLRP